VDPLRRVALLVAPLVALTGCGRSRAGDPTERPAAIAAPGAAPDLVILTRGDAPRTRLRYDFAREASERMTVVVRMSTEAALDEDAPRRFVAPETKIRVAIDERRSAGENLAYRFTIDSVELSSPPSTPKASLFLDEVRLLVGLSGEGEVTARGRVVRADFQQFPDARKVVVKSILAQVHFALLDLTVPLPDEEVGPGATWTTVEAYRFPWLPQGSRSETVTLARTEGGRGVLDVSFSSIDPPQSAALQITPAQGRATKTLDPRRLVSTADSHMTSAVTFESEVDAAKNSRRLGSTFDVHTEPLAD
jgi:hypothetical protein